MTISERINKKFNSHGTTIEESIKNANVGGGAGGTLYVEDAELTEDNRRMTNRTFREVIEAASNGKVVCRYYAYPEYSAVGISYLSEAYLDPDDNLYHAVFFSPTSGETLISVMSLTASSPDERLSYQN